LLRQLQILSKSKFQIVPTFCRVFPSPLWSLLPASAHVALTSALPVALATIGIPALVPTRRISTTQDASRHDHASTADGDIPWQMLPLTSATGKWPPELVIGCGRTTAPSCVALRRLNRGSSFVIQVSTCCKETAGAISMPRPGIRFWQHLASLCSLILT
jgi:hypothetical protein